jgi:hypothetical protein
MAWRGGTTGARIVRQRARKLGARRTWPTNWSVGCMRRPLWWRSAGVQLCKPTAPGCDAPLSQEMEYTRLWWQSAVCTTYRASMFQGGFAVVAVKRAAEGVAHPG